MFELVRGPVLHLLLWTVMVKVCKLGHCRVLLSPKIHGKEKLVDLLSRTLLQEMQYFSPRLLHFISADAAVINSVRHINKWNIYLGTWEKLCICCYWRKISVFKPRLWLAAPTRGDVCGSTSASDGSIQNKHAMRHCCQLSWSHCESHNALT